MNAETTGPTQLELLARAREMARSGEAERIRVDADVSCKEIGEEINVATSSVWMWCKGKSRPTGDRAVRFVRCLDQLSAQAGS